MHSSRQRSRADGGEDDVAATDAHRQARHRSNDLLLERKFELQTVTDAIADGVEGSGRLVVLEGPSGIGKSRMLEAANSIGEARGAEVLTTCGGELEREYPFGLVRRLLETRVTRAEHGDRDLLFRGYAQPAQALLQPAAHEDDSSLTDEFHLIHSLYWLIANLADSRPLVLIADDLQWGDDLSLRFLIYLTQRLNSLPVTIIGAVRTGDPAADQELVIRLTVEADTALRLTELSAGAVKQMLSALVPDVAENPTAVTESWAATRGNPFLLRELASAMNAMPGEKLATLAGRVPGTAPESVARSVMLRLGADAVALARAVAVFGTSTSLVTAADLSGMDYATATTAADRLRRAQIFADATELVFYHPMIRTAVYDKYTLGERAAIHLNAARLLRRTHADLDEVAVHLLRGAPTAEGWARDALHSAARAAGRKGAPAAAIAYLRRALEIPEPDSRKNAGMLIDLGMMEAAAGEGNPLSHLETALDSIDDQQDRARAAYALGQTLFRYGRSAEALTVFRRGADAFTDVDREVALRFEAGYMASASYLVNRPSEAHRRVTALAASFGDPEHLAPAERLLVLHLGVFRAMSQPRSADHAELILRALGDGVQLWRETSDAMTVSHAILALTWCERPREAADIAERILTESRARGDSLIFAEVSLARSLAMYAMGRVGDAMIDAQAAIIGMKRGWKSTVPAPQGVLAYCLLDRDELDEAEAVLHETEELLRDGDTRTLNVWFYMARGRLRLARDDAPAASDDFLRVGALLASNTFFNPGYMLLPWRSYAGLAAHAAGKADEAQTLIDEDIALAKKFGLNTTLGAALRAKALCGPKPDVELLSEAVQILDTPEGSPLELARALLDLGSAQRRGGQRLQSRDALRQALDLAHHSGALAVKRRAHEELLASGARPRRPVLQGADALTPSEQRIASLMAEGKTSRNIAESLYLTLSTVEWHRRNIYRKLDVGSRDELKDALRDGESR